MVKQVLDKKSYEQTQEVLARATRLGLDPVEALHDAGLLLTFGRFENIRIDALVYLHRQIVSWRPAEFLRRRASASHTPADMYNCIVEYIEEEVLTAKERLSGLP